MGIVKNGILGGFSGIVGPVVGSSWKNKQVIRSRPPFKRRRSTPNQLKQMAKVGLMTHFVKTLSSFLAEVYQSTVTDMSCYNKAMSYNLRNAITGDYPAYRINFKQFMLGHGILLNVEGVALSSNERGRIRIRWTDNSGEGSARASDLIFAAVYCESQTDMSQSWRTFMDGAMRSTAGYTMDLFAFSGKTVHVYIGFLSAGAKFVSSSLYAGNITIL